MEVIIGLLIGVGLAFGAAGVLYLVFRSRRAADAEAMRNAFAGLSQQALQANSEQVVRLAKEVLSGQTESAKQELAGDKKLIDRNLEAMSTRLKEVEQFLQKVDREREGTHQALAAQLKTAAEETTKLRETTGQLHAALANPQHRGQWGERMAEDVLQLAGFVENVNYFKQQQADEGTRPDFTFPLPNGLRLHMDVKFPLANYLRYLDAESDEQRERFGKAFISDVRSRIREAATRDYINPADHTVDYALVFIPNEQVYASIHEIDPSVIDSALERKIVLCSPLTLYAVLAVIRQAAKNFAVQEQAHKMVGLIHAFARQWEKFKGELEKLGNQLGTVNKTYDRLSTTRLSQLEKPIDKIDELSSSRPEELEAGPDGEQ
ncbi:MAG: DNA recombination protein RmuC [Planctomycetota bacterium]